eukprot:13693420-Heterocapsa_arctica.AAC.1
MVHRSMTPTATSPSSEPMRITCTNNIAIGDPSSIGMGDAAAGAAVLTAYAFRSRSSALGAVQSAGELEADT